MNAREMEVLSKAMAELINEFVSPLQKRVTELEARFASMPTPEKGADGERGADGRNGVDGKDGRDGVDGKDGAPGERGDNGEPGRDGINGKDGADGRSVTVDDLMPALKSLQSEWALDFERRAQALLQGAIDRMPAAKDGKDGRDGVDGKDGLGFDDMTVEHDGRRTVTLGFVRGEQRKDVALKFGVVLDSGVWKEGNFYEIGDGATFGGSYWIAQKNTDDKPGTSDAWRLAVKKGRDGKDA